MAKTPFNKSQAIREALTELGNSATPKADILPLLIKRHPKHFSDKDINLITNIKSTVISKGKPRDTQNNGRAYKAILDLMEAAVKSKRIVGAAETKRAVNAILGL